MKLLNKLPPEPNKRRWIAIGISILLATPLTAWGIYGIGEYGVAMFILTPLLIGIVSTILFGHGRALTKREAAKISLLTLLIFTLGLIVFAIEGLVCITMAAPIGILIDLDWEFDWPNNFEQNSRQLANHNSTSISKYSDNCVH